MAVRPGLPASLAPLAAFPEQAEAVAALRVTIARRMATTVISAPFHLRRRMPMKICRHCKGDISKWLLQSKILIIRIMLNDFNDLFQKLVAHSAIQK